MINGHYTDQLWLSQGVKQGNKKLTPNFSKTKLISGCNLSPLLFSLFINNLGLELNSSGLGIDLCSQNVASIFFADDIVLIGSSRAALDQLMLKTRTFFHSHHLTLSVTKSKIMSYEAATGNTTFHGSSCLSPLSLDQVLSFKYLGVPLSCSPYSLFKFYNEQVKKRAQDCLSRVLSLVKTGPKRSDLAYCLWNNIAIPSILYGSEVLPLLDGTIKEVERIQSVIGKFILQVPRSTANVSVHIDSGFKPIWAIVAEKFLLFAHNTMAKPSSLWPKLAMNENLLMGNKSFYTRNLIKWKRATESFNLSPHRIQASVQAAAVSDILSQQKISSTTTFAMNSPGTDKAWFKPKPWVSDTGSSKIFAQFRSCNSGLGNRGPAKNGKFYKLCPLCEPIGHTALNNEVSQKIRTIM